MFPKFDYVMNYVVKLFRFLLTADTTLVQEVSRVMQLLEFEI